MNLPQVARMMARFVGFFTVAQVPPLLVSLAEAATPFHSTRGFVVGLLVSGLASALLYAAGRRASGLSFRKEALAVAGLCWALTSLLGAVPFLASNLLPGFFDAVFEATSGLTTCGATVLGGGGNCAPEQAPASLLLWRAEMQWIGGLGIVLVFVALLPAMGVTGKNLLTSESVSISSESYQPRAIEKARVIGGLYLALTALCVLALVTIGGFGWFDAICHGFTTLATGGYSTRSSIAAFDSLPAELVLAVFMFLGGASFTLLAVNWRTEAHGLRTLLRSGEFRLYSLITGAVICAITWSLVQAGAPLGQALRHAVFNGISVLTSTGYATADFQAWPSLAMLVLFFAMFVGGCSGSTSGGLKQVRLLVSLKLCAYTLRHFVRPKIVERIKLNNEVLPAAVISSILAIVLLWCVSAVLGAIALMVLQPMNFTAGLSIAASMLGSTGPALTLVEPASAAAVLVEGGTAVTLAGTINVGPFGSYGDLNAPAKLLLSFLMLLGRLELLTVLALFMPSFWRR